MAKRSAILDGPMPMASDGHALLVDEIDPALSGHAGADPEADALRRQLAAQEVELDRMRAELAKRDAASQPLPNSGAGRYKVILRHSPSRLKVFECDADGEQEAWAKFQTEAIKKSWNPKDPDQRAVKSLERFLADGRVYGFDRTITKVG